MKKLSILASVLMVAIFGLAAMSWAQEASVFDDVEKIIIRAYLTAGSEGECITAQVGPPCYSALIEVRNSDGEVITPDKLVVTGTNLTPDANPFLIHNNDLTKPDISMSIDNDTGTIYIFCTDTTQGLHVMQYKIGTLFPVTGVCGTTLNTCTTGMLNDIADSDTNYLWNCNGANGGTNAPCSLPKPVNGVCGTTLNTCTTGMLNDIADSPTNYLWNCNGANGGTTANCSAPIPNIGKPDLVVTSVKGLGSMFEAGTTLTLTVTIKNQFSTETPPANTGASTAATNACANRQFTVKGYQGSSSTALFTWNVSDLDKGGTATEVFSFVAGTVCGVHTWCSFTVKVDADSCVGEFDETNNSRIVASYRTR